MELEGKELHNDSPAVKEWWSHIEVLMQKSYNTVPTVKRFLGLTLSEHETPIRALGKFVDRIGFTLNKTGKQTKRSQTSDGKRHHIYKLERKCSKQDDIFSHWLNKLECDQFGLDDNQWELLTYLNDESVSLESKVEYFADIIETMAIALMAIAPYVKEKLLVDDLFLPLIKG